MFDEYFESSTVDRLVPLAPTAQALVNPTGPSVSIPIDQKAPSGSHSPSSSDYQSSSVHQGVAAEHLFEVNPFAAADLEPFVNVFTPDHNSEASSSGWWKRGRVSWLLEVVRWGRRNGEDGDVDVGCDVACRSVGEDSDDGGLVVKILAGEDGGSPEKSAGKVFRRRRLTGDGWPEIGERGERILSVRIQTVMDQINKSIRGLLLFQQFITTKINNLKATEGTSHKGGGGSNQYGILTKLEFPKFNGEDALNWHKQFNKRFHKNATWERYDTEVKRRFDLVLEDSMDIGLAVRMFKPANLPDVYCLAKMQEATIAVFKSRIMRVKGFVRKKVVHTLIDCGSTHNFLDWNTARKLRCKLRKIYPLEGITYTTDVMIVPLGGCEMVLEIQWLSTLRWISWKLRYVVSILASRTLRLIITVL
ncbi:hypothetical protein Tco_0811422 [Tanacetum coccineum]